MASKKIFIDGSIFYAFVDRADPNHPQAVKVLEYLSLQRVYLYTSLQAIHDSYSAISNQLGTTIGSDFLNAISESSIEIIYPQKADLVGAIRLLKFNPNKQITLKEVMSANLMQKKGITQILTFSYWHNLLGSNSYLSRN